MKAPFAFFISYLSTYTVNSSLCVASGLWECMILMTIVDAAQQTSKVIEGAKPIASSTVETISSTDPTVIAVAGGILFLAYLLLLPVFSALSFSFRGYKGSKIWNAIFRMENDKDKAGISRLPSSAKNKMIQILLEDLLSKVRNLVRNLKKVEAEIVALKISFIKKVNKGSNIVITDLLRAGLAVIPFLIRTNCILWIDEGNITTLRIDFFNPEALFKLSCSRPSNYVQGLIGVVLLALNTLKIRRLCLLSQTSLIASNTEIQNAAILMLRRLSQVH
ncbi:Calcium sensing receptor, chloroplastic [Capsicum annuum]|nr:Calcium sensing receptor, chloroplastic [Capsicum annuum]